MKTNLWITLLALWISLLPLEGFSKTRRSAAKCGIFEIYGVVRISGSQPTVRLYEKSQSELNFKVDSDLAESLGAYADRPIMLKARLLKPIRKKQGSLTTLRTPQELQKLKGEPLIARIRRDDIKERVPDPLYPMKDSQMKLLKELPCSKKD